jgi:hypothetical protein
MVVDEDKKGVREASCVLPLLNPGDHRARGLSAPDTGCG